MLLYFYAIYLGFFGVRDVRAGVGRAGGTASEESAKPSCSGVDAMVRPAY